jgi:5-(carboxyamino)imidazole ribonucleotide synthase
MYRSPIARVGLIGGGQLGLMVAREAIALDIEISILDPHPFPPAARCAFRHIQGALDDPDAIRTLAENCDIISYEIETGDPGTLRRLRKPVEPSPATLEIIQDKLVQRRHLEGAGIPMPAFRELKTEDADETARILQDFGYPLVHKTRRGGYDGRGVAVINTPLPAGQNDPTPLPASPISWNGESYIEEAVSIRKELAVLVARSTDGEIRSYEPVEMHFDPSLNLVDAVIYPADIPPETVTVCRDTAMAAVAALSGAGIFAVELFYTDDHRVLVNEIAPRPHNSGHLTIEAAVTSQFQQHLRAITGLPLGDTTFHQPAVMRNILGGPVPGEPHYRGVDAVLSESEVSLHLYGKKETRPGRKMGHITATGADGWDKAHRSWRKISVNGV